MMNMKLPQELQDEIRKFMLETQNNLDNQRELDNFMLMISPSLRTKVVRNIVMDAIKSNPIFSDASNLLDFLINDVSTLLYLPEDNIIRQGQVGNSLLLIAKGDCSVWVKNHRREEVFVRKLGQG